MVIILVDGNDYSYTINTINNTDSITITTTCILVVYHYHILLLFLMCNLDMMQYPHHHEDLVRRSRTYYIMCGSC